MTLKILPHGRLQEWVAEEQGYFTAEGLEYTFLPEGDYGVPAGQVGTGAFETFGVFLPYTREVFAATQAWTRRVFSALPEAAPYDEAALA